MGKVKRTLSVVLAVAMVITMVPQTGMYAFAEEADAAVEAVTEAAEVEEVTSEETLEVSTEDPADAEDAQAEDTEDGSVDEDGGGETAEAPEEEADAPEAEEPVEDADAPTEETPEAEEPAEETPEVVEGEDSVLDAEVMETGDSHTVTASTGDGYTVNLPDNGAAKEGTDYEFTITVADYYKIISVEYTVTDGKANESLTEQDGKYTIPGDDITDDVAITVTAAKKTHSVTANYEDEVEITSEQVASISNGVEATVEEGQDLTFTVKLKEANKETHRITEVKYQVTDADEQEATAVEGVYTFTISKGAFNNDVKINVTSEPIPTYDVTLEQNDNITLTYAIDDAEVNNEYSQAVQVTEGHTFKFKLEAKDVYQVTKVEITTDDEPEEIKANTDGIYSFEVTAKTKITVTTKYDPAKVNQLHFAVASGSDSKSYKATVELDEEDDVKTPDWDEEDFTDGETLLSKGKKFKVKIESDNYDIKEVKLNGVEEALTEQDGYYEVDFGEETTGEKTLTVTTAVKTKESDVTVTFESESTNLALDVKTSETVIKNDDGSYTIKAGEGYFNFTITPTGAYMPKVEVNGDEIDTPELTDGKYSYTILVYTLEDTNTITIDEVIAEHTITVLRKDSQVAVTAKVGAKSLYDSPGEEDDEITYTVDDGQTVAIDVKARKNSKVTKVEYKVGTAEAVEVKQGLTDAGVRFELKDVEENIYVTVTSEALRTPQPLYDRDNDEYLTPDKKGVYSVRYNGTYMMEVYEGEGEDAGVTVKDVKVKEGSTEIPEKTGDAEPITNWTKSLSGSEAEITLTKELAGKSLVFELYAAGEGAGAEDVLIASYSVTTSKLVDDSKITVKDIKQATDTELTYKVTVNAGASVDDLNILVDEASNGGKLDGESNDVVVKNAEIENGVLKVITGFRAGETTLILTASDSESVSGNSVGSKRVKVTTTALVDKDATKAPTVKVANSTDISITLTLGAKGIAEPVTGKVYYEVKATAQDQANTPEGLEKEVVKYFAKEGDSQNAPIQLGKQPTLGTGAQCAYDVEVRLVHIKDKSEPTTVENCNQNLAVADKSYSQSFTTGTKPFETKTPYYETNLKLKKGTTTVYTTQEDVVVAIPQFSKDTSYMAIDGENTADITANLGEYEKLSVSVETNEKTGIDEIKVSANEYTYIGKHTIQVFAMTTDDDTMYASRATIVVTVVRGIEELEVTVPSTSLYKASGKAATLAPTVIYNENGTGNYAPKTKKVTWSLLDSDYENEGTSVLGGKVSINASNGKVTVAKDYVVSANEEDNTFVIKATAADYKDNRGWDVEDTVEVTITNEAMTIGSLAILNGDNKVIVKDGESVEASKLDGAELVAFANGAPVKDIYSYTDIETYKVDSSNVKFTSSNAKAVSINNWDGSAWIEANAPAKNVTLTALAGDGSNAKKTMKITVVYDTTNELGLEFHKYNPDWQDYEEGALDGNLKNLNLEFADSTTARFVINVKELVDGEWVDNEKLTNYKVTVKGGKLISSYAGEVGDAGEYELVTSSEVTTVTLQDKGNNNTKAYVLTNKGLANLKGIKAPKATLTGLYDGYSDPQVSYGKITNTVKEDKAGYIDFSNAWVKVDVDWTAYSSKNAWTLEELEYQMSPTGYQKLNADGSFELRFAYDDDYSWLTAGNYKLKVNVGTVDEDGNFVCSNPAAAVTLKVTKQKAVSFKPTTSYTIAAKDGGYAVLTGKGNWDYVSFSKLQNANIKGKENKFTHYFVLGYSTDYKPILKLTQAWYDEGCPDLTTAELKDNLTGYVHYRATKYSAASVNRSSDWVEDTVKITVKMKKPGETIAKYTLSNGSIYTSANSTVTVELKAGKNPAVAAYALATTDGWSVTSDGVVNSDKITLTHTGDLGKGVKYPVTVKVILEDSEYANRYYSAEGTDAKKKVIEDYGIELTTTITAQDEGAVNKRISIASAALKQQFVAEDSTANRGYDVPTQNYWINVPYTEVYNKTTINRIETDKYSDLISFNRLDGQNVISITINKDALKAAVDADKKDNGAEKYTFYDKNDKPKTLSVKATVFYAEGADAPNDSFNFKLTMPTKAQFYNEDGKTDYASAIEYIKSHVDEIAADVTIPRYNEWWDDENVQWQLYDAIKAHVGADSGIDFNVDGENYGSIEGFAEVTDFTEPESIKKGTLEITAHLKNALKEEDEQQQVTTTDVVFTWDVKATGTMPEDLREATEKFIDKDEEGSKDYGYNEVQQNDVLRDLRSYMASYAAEKGWDISNLRFDLWDWYVEEARIEDDTPYGGTVSFTVHIWDIMYGYDEITEDASYEIPEPKLQSEVVDAVKEAVGASGSDADDTLKELIISNVPELVKEDVLKAAQEAIGADTWLYDVKYAKDGENDVFSFTPVTATAGGKLSFTLLVTDKEGKLLSDGQEEPSWTGEIKVEKNEDTFPADANIMTLAEAETKVNAWLAELKNPESDAYEAFYAEDADWNQKEAADFLAEVKKIVPEASGVTVTIDGFAKEISGFFEDGSMVGDIVMNRDDIANDPTRKVAVKFELVIPKQKMELEAAKSAASNAANEVEVSNDDDETEAKAKKQAVILKAAQDAVTSDWVLQVKEDAELTITKATINKQGSATMTLQIAAAVTEGEPQYNDTDVVEVNIVIKELEQTPADAKRVVVAAIETLDELEDTVSADNFITAVKDKLGNGNESTLKKIYDLKWADDNGFEVSGEGDKEVTGTLNIVYVDGVEGHDENEVAISIKIGSAEGDDVSVSLKSN